MTSKLLLNTRVQAIAFAIVAVIGIFVQSVATGKFGQLGTDPDDIMRFVQVRDWMAGQSWFVTDQARLGPEGGTDMHWSRLPDVPIAALAALFDLFTTRDRALHLAASVWPPLVGALFILVIGQGARRLGGKVAGQATVFFTLLLAAVFVTRNIRFKPGSIDHHNIQMVLLVACLVGLIRVDRFKSGLLAGLVLAGSIAIGPEIFPIAGVICLFVALDWAVVGFDRRQRAIGFGVGLGTGLIGLFVATVAPREYMLTYCDQLSDVTVLAGSIGGFGLALAARFTSDRGVIVRLVSLAVMGVAALTTLVGVAPQCLTNPYAALPTDMKTFWLNRISETHDFKELGEPLLVSVPYLIGTATVALVVLAWRIFKHGPSSRRIGFICILLVCIALTFYQIRFHFFAQVTAMLVLGAWVGACHAAGKSKQNNIAYIGALALSVPAFLAFPGYLLFDGATEADKEKVEVECLSEDVLTALNALPTGLVASSSNAGTTLLKSTDHRTLSANYHRNVEGILAQINIHIAEPEAAMLVLRDYEVDYFLSCQGSKELAYFVQVKPDGLAAAMEKGDVPTGLDPIGVALEDGAVQIYRVVD